MSLSHVAARVARSLSLDRQAEFWLGEVDPAWSLAAVRGRVERVIEETADTKTFVFRPNRHWQRHRAGQHTSVEVELDGVRVRRCYSISSAPADPSPAITVKRAPGGRISGWLHDHVRRGHVLRLGLATGDFVLPDMPRRLLLLGGGSGITPLMSMLRDLADRGALEDVVLAHHARTGADVIFRRELEALRARHAGLRVLLCLTDGSSGHGRFEEAQLRRLVPDFAERETFLCGPPRLMERVDRLWARAGATDRLHRERFAAAPPPAMRGGAEVRITLAPSGRSFVARRAGTLLEQLERAGERPRFGCRMGVCGTCKVTKRSGTIEDLRSGARSARPDEIVQPCVSVARSDVEVCL